MMHSQHLKNSIQEAKKPKNKKKIKARTFKN